METDDSYSADDDRFTKSYGGHGVKISRNPDEGKRSSDSDRKTISKDRSLLIGELVDSGLAKFDERHQAKAEGDRDIEGTVLFEYH